MGLKIDSALNFRQTVLFFPLIPSPWKNLWQVSGQSFVWNCEWVIYIYCLQQFSLHILDWSVGWWQLLHFCSDEDWPGVGNYPWTQGATDWPLLCNRLVTASPFMFSDSAPSCKANITVLVSLLDISGWVNILENLTMVFCNRFLSNPTKSNQERLSLTLNNAWLSPLTRTVSLQVQGSVRCCVNLNPEV